MQMALFVDRINVTLINKIVTGHVLDESEECTVQSGLDLASDLFSARKFEIYKE